MAKTTKKSVKKVQVTSGLSVPSLLGLALLLGLLCILPWVSRQNGSDSLRALQVSLALLLALGGGICLGLQIAANRKK
jgi:glucose dehydrogenase